MTRPDIEAIAKRCEAATEGPWTIECRSTNNPTNDPAWPVDDFLQFHILGPVVPSGRGDFMGRDADFVAHARQDIPALLAYIAALEESLEEGA